MKHIINTICGNDQINTDLAIEILSLWCEYEGIPIMNNHHQNHQPLTPQQQLTSFTTLTEEEYNQLIIHKVYSYESILAHQLDKLEMIIQANEYEEKEQDKRQSPDFLQSFFQSTCYTNGQYDVNKGIFIHSEMIEWVNELIIQRNKRINIFCKNKLCEHTNNTDNTNNNNNTTTNASNKNTDNTNINNTNINTVNTTI